MKNNFSILYLQRILSHHSRIWFPGFGADVKAADATNAQAFIKFAEQNGFDYICQNYPHRGEEEDESLFTLDSCVHGFVKTLRNQAAKNPSTRFVFVCSSFGSWAGLLTYRYLKSELGYDAVKGIVMWGAWIYPPEFGNPLALSYVWWNGRKSRISRVESKFGERVYWSFVQNARCEHNRVWGTGLLANVKCPIRVMHAHKDDVGGSWIGPKLKTEGAKDVDVTDVYGNHGSLQYNWNQFTGLIKSVAA